MELNHEFDVAVPVDRAWELFTDLSRVIPNLPGAGLEGQEGDITLGNVKVKVGPVTAQYKGKAWFLERDTPGRKVVVRAEGRDARGQGNAKATIEVQLAGDDTRTHADVRIDMSITGRLAQIGRGLIADVSAKLMQEFVGNLEAELAGEPASSSASPPRAQAESTELALPVADGEESQAVDLIETAGVPLLRRVGPLALGALALIILLRLVAC